MNYRVYLLDEHRPIRAGGSFSAQSDDEANEIATSCIMSVPTCFARGRCGAGARWLPSFHEDQFPVPSQFPSRCGKR